MTPQEKEAKRIFYLFKENLSPMDYNISKPLIKEGALICVREKLSSIPGLIGSLKPKRQFYKEVEKILKEKY